MPSGFTYKLQPGIKFTPECNICQKGIQEDEMRVWSARTYQDKGWWVHLSCHRGQNTPIYYRKAL